MRTIHVKLYSAVTNWTYSDRHLIWEGNINVPNRIIGYPDVVLHNKEVFTFRHADITGVKYQRARFVKVKNK